MDAVTQAPLPWVDDTLAVVFQLTQEDGHKTGSQVAEGTQQGARNQESSGCVGSARHCCMSTLDIQRERERERHVSGAIHELIPHWKKGTSSISVHRICRRGYHNVIPGRLLLDVVDGVPFPFGRAIGCTEPLPEGNFSSESHGSRLCSRIGSVVEHPASLSTDVFQARVSRLPLLALAMRWDVFQVKGCSLSFTRFQIVSAILPESRSI